MTCRIYLDAELAATAATLGTSSFLRLSLGCVGLYFDAGWQPLSSEESAVQALRTPANSVTVSKGCRYRLLALLSHCVQVQLSGLFARARRIAAVRWRTCVCSLNLARYRVMFLSAALPRAHTPLRRHSARARTTSR